MDGWIVGLSIVVRVSSLLFPPFLSHPVGGDRRHQPGQVSEGPTRPRGGRGTRRPGGELAFEAKG